MARRSVLSLALVTAVLGTGCASAPSASPPPAGVDYRQDKELQKVWLAEGFDFRGYDTLVVGDTRADVPKLNPDGAESLEWARGVLRDELVAALQEKVFAAGGHPRGRRQAGEPGPPA